MSFKEKSAWVMLLGLLISGLFYLATVLMMSKDGQLAPPIMPILIVYTIILTVIAIAGHVIIALFAPKEANAKTDEREQLIVDKSGYLSSQVFAFGVILSLMYYLVSYNGPLLFYSAFASLILAQMLEYVMQIYFLRRTI